MKKNCVYISREQRYSPLRKILLTMKLSVFLFLLGIMSVQAKEIFSQTSLNIQMKDASVEEVLEEVRSQSNYDFIYDYEYVNDLASVDVDFNNATLDAVLYEILKRSKLDYRLEDEVIILFPREIMKPVSKEVNKKEVQQEKKTIVGVVTDENGSPLPGVNVVEKGTMNGTSTSIEGLYSLNVESGKSILVFSFVGFSEQEVAIDGKSNIDIVLEANMTGIDEVVVTALGIKRKEKSLAYATESVSSEDLNSVSSVNFINNLAGKTAGVQINSAGAGVGSSTRVIIRGNRSIQGNNQPLFVIDGIPVDNIAPGQSGGGAGNGGDGLAGLNSEDIESMNILKGAAAAALYGSRAANGAVMITTKSGKAGKTSVTINSSYQVEKSYIDYDFQQTYAESTSNAWGTKAPSSRTFHEDFFDTGYSLINSVSISTGNKNVQSFISYGNTEARGIMPGHEVGKNNFNVRTKAKLFDDFLEIDAKLNVNRMEVVNGPSEGNEQNVIRTFYSFPGDNASYNDYRNNYTVYDPARNTEVNRWYAGASNEQANPRWILEKNNFLQNTNRVLGKIDLTFNLREDLKFIVRGAIDRTEYEYEQKVPLGGILINTGTNGNYQIKKNTYEKKYADAILTYTKTFDEKFYTSATIGSSIDDNQSTRLHIGNNQKGNLMIPNVFTITNLENGGNIRSQGVGRDQLQSVFGTVTFGYNDMMYLDVTGRNDWSSTLSSDNRSFFYPSVGLSVIASNFLKEKNSLPSYVDFLKIRGSWTKVGNDVPRGIVNPQETINIDGGINPVDKKPFTDMKPEESTSMEFGLDLRLFKKLRIDFSTYKTNTINQYFELDSPPGTGYSQYYINAGDVQNIGVELMLDYSILKNSNFTIDSWLNFSSNKNKVISLPEVYTETGISKGGRGYNFMIKEGEEFGIMYAEYLDADEQGRLILDENGAPMYAKDENGANAKKAVGNTNADFHLGFGTEMAYKNFSLKFLIDGRFGGDVISSTENELHGKGLTPETAFARDNGGVEMKGVYADYLADDGDPAIAALAGQAVSKIDTYQYYTTANAATTSMYDATNVRLREISLGYDLPSSFTNRIGLNSVKLSLVGRNLFFLYKDAPFDPENFSNTSSLSGGSSDYFSLPSTRYFGVNVNINF